MGYFGTSKGTAALLITARELKSVVKAVVSKGGRPGLAEDALMYVEAPTLFIVGGENTEGIDLNQRALGRMFIVDKDLKIISGSNSLFEEQGALEEVARLAGYWFKRYLL